MNVQITQLIYVDIILRVIPEKNCPLSSVHANCAISLIEIWCLYDQILILFFSWRTLSEIVFVYFSYDIESLWFLYYSRRKENFTNRKSAKQFPKNLQILVMFTGCWFAVNFFSMQLINFQARMLLPEKKDWCGLDLPLKGGLDPLNILQDPSISGTPFQVQ